MNDLHIILDLLVARLLWMVVTELIVKPFLFRQYDRLDKALGDRLPDRQRDSRGRFLPQDPDQ